MSEIKVYEVAKRGDLEKLVEVVNSMVKQGWRPIGGIAISDDLYAQAMVRNEARDPAKKRNPKESTLSREQEAELQKGVARELEKIEAADSKRRKEPIIVKALAEELKARPFQIISELMEMNIFVQTSDTLKPEVANAIRDKHDKPAAKS